MPVHHRRPADTAVGPPLGSVKGCLLLRRWGSLQTGARWCPSRWRPGQESPSAGKPGAGLRGQCKRRRHASGDSSPLRDPDILLSSRTAGIRGNCLWIRQHVRRLDANAVFDAPMTGRVPRPVLPPSTYRPAGQRRESPSWLLHSKVLSADPPRSSPLRLSCLLLEPGIPS